MIYIRTDANENIATGHVMRCLTIAKRLIQIGETVVFVVADEQSVCLIKAAGMKYIVLNTDWSNPDNDIELGMMKQLLDSYRAKHGEQAKLLIDSYMIDGEYTDKLHSHAKIIVIDDLFEYTYNADMIINYTLYNDIFDYAGRYGSNTGLCLGGSYVPLRDEFADISAKPCNSGELDVLVICGGGDTLNCLTKIVQSVAKDNMCSRHRYHVVAGAYNQHKDELHRQAQMYDWLNVYDNVSDMVSLMRKCDIAVSAASTVLYECCAVKLPTIFFTVADNQRFDRDCFSADDVMIYAGDMQSEPDMTRKRICSAIQELATDCVRRQHMQRKMQKLVDGNGALRIAQKIMEV